MKIGNSQVAMESKGLFFRETTKKSTQKNVFVVNNIGTKASGKDVGRDAKVKEKNSYNADGTQKVNSLAEVKMRLLEQILSAIQDRKHHYSNNNENYQIPYPKAFENGSGNLLSTGVFVREYTEETTYFEQEEVAFSSTGCVRTEDGREIQFDIGFAMKRTYEERQTVISHSEVMLCDPLVLNFTGDPEILANEKFFFDLNGDGVEEEISKLTGNCGFLALDKNNDGIINDGRELFGAQTGDGFADLSAYDEDGNGWIDENDSIFDKLKIWRNGKVSSLKESGAGAIYLNNVPTEFSINNPYDNENMGVMRSSSIFLNEDGTAGTISHVNFAI